MEVSLQIFRSLLRFDSVMGCVIFFGLRGSRNGLCGAHRQRAQACLVFVLTYGAEERSAGDVSFLGGREAVPLNRFL